MPKAVETPLPLEVCRAIDSVCDVFEQAWMKGERPSIEEQLATTNVDGRPILLAELIRIELEWRSRRGERPSEADYAIRFPVCADHLGEWLAEAKQAAELARDAAADTADHLDPGLSSPAASTGSFQAAPPRTLGEYELLEPLGAGGMGEVYKARHRRLDKLVALKLLRASERQSGDRIARFLREMKAIGALDHPNVAEAYDAGEQAGIVYLAMKLIDGIDLGRLVKEKGPLPVAEACDLVRQAALGLDYLHRRSLIHRDLKPSNLMRTPDGVVKVLDFGLARWPSAEKTRESLTAPGMIVGTPDYVAPEQVLSVDPDQRADLYGLGGVLFFLLTGQAPFAHQKGLFEKLDAHVKEQPPDPRTLRKDIPAVLARLVARLLAKFPDQRPQTAAEVAQVLTAISSGKEEQGGTPPLSPRPEAVDPGKAEPSGGRGAGGEGGQQRRRLVWTMTAAVAIAALLMLAVHHNRSDRPRENPPRSVPPARVAVLKFDVKHYANDKDADGNSGDRPMGLLGEKSFDTRLGDSVEVEVELSRPAYAYLIAFRADGGEEVLSPDSGDEAPLQSARLRYPPPAKRGVNYGLDEGIGLQAFAVVVSSRPLPSYNAWRQKRGPNVWGKHAASPGVVWQDQGDGMLDFTSTHPRSERGKDREIIGKTPLAQLTDGLRQAPDVETVATIGFAVLPKANKR